MIEEIKTIKISSKRQITIPSSFDSIKAGGKALLKIEGNKIIIEPIKEYNTQIDELSLINENMLKEDWLSEEDEKAYGHLKELIKKDEI
ncbi:MAG: AbrB/MazE/SpoVT family DNA-binding domain-containing protein [Nanoarchaeota archaeon]